MEKMIRSRVAVWAAGLLAALCALVLLAPASHAAEGTLVGADIRDGQIYGYYGEGGDITIPNTVTTIAPEAFLNNDNVTSITIPGSVSTIGYSAFEGCTALEAIYFPDSEIGADLTIRINAFMNCPELKECTIPACAVLVTGNPFKGCSNMTEIKVDPANPYYFTDEEGVLFGPWLDYGAPQYDDPYTLQAYPCGRAEGGYQIPSVVHGHSVNQLWASSFNGAKNLTSVEIPATCTILGGNAFNGTGLKEITIPSTVQEVGAGLLENCKNLTDVVIQAPVVNMEMGMFQNCTSLQRVTLPNTVRTLGMDTFKNCTSLTTMILPEGLATLDLDTFEQCTNLQRIYIPASVTSFPGIDGMAFDPFEGTSSNLVVYVAAGSKAEKWAYNHAEEFGWNYQVIAGPQQLPTLDIGTIELVDMGSRIKVSGAFHMGDTLEVERVTSGPVFDAFRTSADGAVAVYQIGLHGDAAVPQDLTLYLGRPAGMSAAAELYTLQGSAVTPVPFHTVSGTLTAQVNSLGSFAVIDGTVTGGGETGPVVPTQVRLNRSTAELTVGQKLQLSAAVLPDTAPDKSVTWESSAPSIAQVSDRGVVLGVADGSAVITATTVNGLKAKCQVTVKAETVEPPVPTASITASAAVRAGDALTAAGQAPFQVSLAQAARIATVQVEFETTGSDVKVEGRNGFALLGNVNGQQQGNTFRGSAMLCYLTDGPALFSSVKECTIAEFAVTGEEPVFRVTGLTISGWDNSHQVAYGTVTGIEPGEAVFEGPLGYDLNRDGVVDQLDITWAQMYYRAETGDANWETARRCDFNRDQLIDIMDFIQILQNFTVTR